MIYHRIRFLWNFTLWHILNFEYFFHYQLFQCSLKRCHNLQKTKKINKQTWLTSDTTIYNEEVLEYTSYRYILTETGFMNGFDSL